MGWSLADIRRKVRDLTGRQDSEELSTNRLDEYINNYYQYTFPSEVKLDEQYVLYSFNTSANVKDYTFPKTTYTNVTPPLRLNGTRMDWYQDPTLFYQRFQKEYTTFTIGTGDGATFTFANTLNSPPVIAGSITVTDNTEVFTDNEDGTLTGSAGGSGTINYTTGAISVTFFTAPSVSQTIAATYISYVAAKPNAVLFFDNTFTFDPIPDTVYQCEIKAFKIVTALSQATDTPPLQEWGPAIAYGTARSIFADYGEMDRYAEMELLYRQQIEYILTRTVQNLTNTRSIPSF